MHPTLLSSLPSETLLHICSFLDARDITVVGSTCRKLQRIATSDDLWRPIVYSCLEKSPPIRSSNVSTLTNPPPPWNPSFGIISTDRNPALAERWFAVPPGADSDDDGSDADGQGRPANFTLPGAGSYFEVYRKFVHHFQDMLGWWIGDLPSYGMIIRIVFHPSFRPPSPDSEDDTDGTPAFICEKVHLVNRLHGMGSAGMRSPWMEATSFDTHDFRGVAVASSEGTTIETSALSMDVSVPGIKTERLWVACWDEYQQGAGSTLAPGTASARIAWRGANAHLTASSTAGHDADASDRRGQRQGQSSIYSRARSLAAEMVFGPSSREAREEAGLAAQGQTMDLDEAGAEEDEEDEEMNSSHGPLAGPDLFRQNLTLSTIMAATAEDTFDNGDFDHIPQSLRTIQQRNGDQIHTVFLSSGAIYTTPAPALEGSQAGKGDGGQGAMTIKCGKYKPYENAEYNTSRAFKLDLYSNLPLPPIDFPPPSLLPLVRDLEGLHFPPTSEPAAFNSSPAFERFLDRGADFELSVLRMDPCPPYRPWPHLSQPQPSGLRFFPVQSPPKQPLQATPLRHYRGQDCQYTHTNTIPRHLDPGSPDFHWDALQGLYAMTYGPWGLEVIYIRSRLLTIHDFPPHVITPRTKRLIEPEELSRVTGPNGLGHVLSADRRRLEDGLRWKPEPYIDTGDLQMGDEETEFIKPGCRVIEGVKCSGDANVPRGTISFRAFSRGQEDDNCVAYFPPGSQWANFPPWDGRGSSQSRQSFTRSTKQTPGRILDCATGRLAMQGFVGAGCWKRCSVKISSCDEIQVYWEALQKVAVCKRLTAC